MTPYVTWKEYYSVSDSSLDGQHKQILGIINELYEAMEAGADFKAVKLLLDRLVKYSLDHFKCEEAIMLQHDYPGFAEHKARHDKLRQRTIDLRDHADLVTGRDLLHFLKEWWSGHIQECDKQYAPYLELAAKT